MMRGLFPRRAVWLISFFILGISNGALAYERGDIVGVSEITTISDADLKDLQDWYEIPADESRLITGIEYYKILYATKGVDGGIATASGLVIVPTGAGLAPYPLLSFQHGTETNRRRAPSRDIFGDEQLGALLLYAARGYLVVLPDGLGLGCGNAPFHPYLHAESEASSAVDLIKAVQKFSRRPGYSLSGQLFLAGFSQGGHWTMALHRQLEIEPISGLTIAVSAPMAGPFDLSNTTVRAAIEHPGRHSAVLMAYGLFSMQSIYGSIATCWNQVMSEPSASRMPVLFDGTHNLGAIYRNLARSPQALFRPHFLKALLDDPNSPARQALAKNDVYDWTPRAPMILVHSRGDEIVSYINSQIAFTGMTGRGARVEFITIPGAPGHVSSFLLAHQIAAARFEKFRN